MKRHDDSQRSQRSDRLRVTLFPPMGPLTRACPALSGPARTLCSVGGAVQWADDPTPTAHRHPDLPHPAGTGLLLVDKTAFMERLLDEGTHYFLSRPRRFGKSLFLDTLKELFEGSEELFEGLHIHARHDWSERYPVVRLSFGGSSFTEPVHLQ